jgi:hypothetical protein
MYFYGIFFTHLDQSIVQVHFLSYCRLLDLYLHTLALQVLVAIVIVVTVTVIWNYEADSHT